MILLGMKNKIVKIYFEAWNEILIVEIPDEEDEKDEEDMGV